jgi:DNA-binding SARP family transcriptional activator
MELRGPFPPGTNMQRPERGLSRVAVLGSPKVIHDGSRLTFSLRKAQALLLYLAVEKGLHPRSKLAALLWPDSESHTARAALRYALTLLCSRLNASPVAHSHLLIQQDVLGLNPQAPLDLDLDVVQQAWREALRLSTVPDEPQRTALVAQVQHALSLVRGPFLDGFWLREEAPFDAWAQQQQRQWQVRLLLLYDRLSGWQEAAGELEHVRAILVRCRSTPPAGRTWPRRCRSSRRRTPWPSTFVPLRLAAQGVACHALSTRKVSHQAILSRHWSDGPRLSPGWSAATSKRDRGSPRPCCW